MGRGGIGSLNRCVCVLCGGWGAVWADSKRQRGSEGLSLEGRGSKKLTLGGMEARGSPQIHNRRRRG